MAGSGPISAPATPRNLIPETRGLNSALVLAAPRRAKQDVAAPTFIRPNAQLRREASSEPGDGKDRRPQGRSVFGLFPVLCLFSDVFRRTITIFLGSPTRSMSTMPDASMRSLKRANP